MTENEPAKDTPMEEIDLSAIKLHSLIGKSQRNNVIVEHAEHRPDGPDDTTRSAGAFEEFHNSGLGGHHLGGQHRGGGAFQHHTQS